MIKNFIFSLFLISVINAIDVDVGRTITLHCPASNKIKVLSVKWLVCPSANRQCYLIFSRHLFYHIMDQSIVYMFGKVSSTGNINGSRDMNLIIRNVSTIFVGEYRCRCATPRGHILSKNYFISRHGTGMRIESEDSSTDDDNTGITVYHYAHVPNPVVTIKPGYKENVILSSLYVYLTIGMICFFTAFVYCAIVLYMVYEKKKSLPVEIFYKAETVPLQ